MTLLITGGTGYLGREIVRQSLALGHQVIVPVRDHSCLSMRNEFGQDNLTLLKIDTLDDIPPDPEARLIHLAWDNVGSYKSIELMTETLPQQISFLKRMITGGMRDITVSGTCLEYGLQDGMLSENSDCKPVTFYGLAKLALYETLQLFQKENPFHLKWLRYFYVYGEGQRKSSLFSQLITAIENGDDVFNMSQGDQQRDFIKKETLAHNTICAAIQNSVTGIINIGNGHPQTVLSLAESIRQSRNSDIKFNLGYYPYPNYEPFSFWADTSKLKTITGAITDEKNKL